MVIVAKTGAETAAKWTSLQPGTLFIKRKDRIRQIYIAHRTSSFITSPEQVFRAVGNLKLGSARQMEGLLGLAKSLVGAEVLATPDVFGVLVGEVCQSYFNIGSCSGDVYYKSEMQYFLARAAVHFYPDNIQAQNEFIEFAVVTACGYNHKYRADSIDVGVHSSLLSLRCNPDQPAPDYRCILI